MRHGIGEFDLEVGKDCVGMGNCFYCNEPKEVILHKHMRKVLPRSAVYDYEPCHKCKGYMHQGVILISVNEKLTKDLKNPYRSGGWCVVTEDFLRRAISTPEILEDILKRRVAFLPDEVWDGLGLPRGPLESVAGNANEESV